MKDIFKHSREFLRALRNRRYDRTDEGGVLFSAQKVILAGVGGIRNITRDGPWLDAPNIVTIQGVMYLLTTGLNSGSASSTWYFAPYAQNITPVNTLTAANFDSTQDEFTNYTQTTRQECNFSDAVSPGLITNLANVATITIGAGGETSVYGMGILSAAAKNSGAGVCLAVPALTAGRTGLQSGDDYGLKYSLTGTSS